MKTKPDIKALEKTPFDSLETQTIVYKSDNHKKEMFVELYNKLMGHISNTCAAVPISRDTYYRWLDEDKNFAKAIMESEMNLNDEIRDVLIQKAGSGDMAAVIFYLKKRHPDFKETPQVLQQFNVDKGNGITFVNFKHDSES